MDPIICTSKSKHLRALCSAALLVVACAATTGGASAQNQMANSGMYQGQGQGAPMGGNQVATNPALLRDWFTKYDAVRRQAQMSPAERSQADGLMSKGLQIFMPGEEKNKASNLLTMLVGKYDRACNQLKMLPVYPETNALHHQYFNYFAEAKALFSDYLVVQNNLMAKDSNGRSVMAGLMERKAVLENTEGQAKATDDDVRNRLGIPPYHF